VVLLVHPASMTDKAEARIAKAAIAGPRLGEAFMGEPLTLKLPRTGDPRCTTLVEGNPDFLLLLMALARPMRLSLMKAAHVAVSSVAKQEIRAGAA
jgi:hypothetical protein